MKSAILLVLRGALLLAAMLLSRPGTAAECPPIHGLLRVEQPLIDQVIARVATDSELRALQIPVDGMLPHPLMAIAYEFDEHIAVVHRVVAAPGGGYCDAPEKIVLRFGAISRHALLLAAADNDRCVRDALLAHEAEHYGLIRAAVSAFLYRHRVEVAEATAQLTTATAGTEAESRVAFETGIQRLVAGLFQEFKAREIPTIRQTVDSPARLAALRHACEGRVDSLERTLPSRAGIES